MTARDAGNVLASYDTGLSAQVDSLRDSITALIPEKSATVDKPTAESSLFDPPEPQQKVPEVRPDPDFETLVGRAERKLAELEAAIERGAPCSLIDNAQGEQLDEKTQ